MTADPTLLFVVNARQPRTRIVMRAYLLGQLRIQVERDARRGDDPDILREC